MKDHGEFVAFAEFGAVEALVVDLQRHGAVLHLDKAETIADQAPDHEEKGNSLTLMALLTSSELPESAPISLPAL